MRAFEWFDSWPPEIKIGIIIIFAAWFVFMLALPRIKIILQRRWRKLREEQCRRKQKVFFKILFWSHVVVISFAFFGLNYAQNNIKFCSKYVDLFLPYYFVVVALLIVMQILYESMKGYVTERFGPDPIELKWAQFINFIARHLELYHKKIKSSAVYNRIFRKLRLKNLIIRSWIRDKIKNLF